MLAVAPARRRSHGPPRSPWWFRGLLGLLSVALALGTQAPPSGATEPNKGGTIIYAVHEGMPTFDIHDETTYIAAQPIGPLYNGLLTFDVYDHEKIVGDLAERWEVTLDGKQITFGLQKGVTFHDGTSLSCADAQYSIEKMSDPKRSHRTFVAIMEEIVASATCTDDMTLVVTLKKPSAAIVTVLAGAHAVVMKAGIAEQIDRKDPKFLVGTGPFKFKSYTPGVDFRAEQNPHYWKPGLPYLERISQMTGAFTGNRAWPIGIVSKPGHRYKGLRCTTLASLNVSGARMAGVCELCRPIFSAAFF
ncbi:MAG: hypothetical protein FJZ47_05340 [Candidatus Tectomicrobia bacterium]|uniref:Solute-binding protein family 5 domain-containing protein n=1 Tax=Tectimicrobiota bacterium TaxID=2528274 RepID=A0A938B2X8_UNCTE|nr:hypothetical protein [Candidatus Tectomicrobia bacterium]